MKLRVKILLCIFLVLFAAASLLAVLADLGALPGQGTAPAQAETGYALRAWQDHIAVFSPPDAQTPVLVTDIRVRQLPVTDRLALMTGVAAADRGAVARLLEDYGA